jgi:hypothetical protein
LLQCWINFAADEVIVETLRVIEGNTADCKLNYPWGICIDLEGVHWHDHDGDLLLSHLGDIIVTDYGDHQIKKITKEGRVVRIAGSTRGTLSCMTRYLMSEVMLMALALRPSSMDLVASVWTKKETTLWQVGLALIHSVPILTVLDSDNHAIRRVSRSGVVSTLVSPSKGGYRDGPVNQAMLCTPEYICMDAHGILVGFVSGLIHF